MKKQGCRREGTYYSQLGHVEFSAFVALRMS